MFMDCAAKSMLFNRNVTVHYPLCWFVCQVLRREGFCCPAGQRSVVPPLQQATAILDALNKLKVNINSH